MVVKLLAPDSTGASLTSVTVMVDVAVAVLNAVVPPLLLVSTLVPATPLVWSQARKVIEALAPLLPSGTKRTLSEERSSSAELPETVPMLVQVLPLSVEYCQVPVPELMAVAVMAMRSEERRVG